MWNKATANMPAQGQSNAHSHAAVMAFAAHQRAKATKVLQGQATDAPSGFQDAIAKQAGVKVPDVHGAIDRLAQAGQITPAQGAMLKAHKGKLHGPAGAATQKAILQALVDAKAGPMPGPVAPQDLNLQMPQGVQPPQGAPPAGPLQGAPPPMGGM